LEERKVGGWLCGIGKGLYGNDEEESQIGEGVYGKEEGL
jgi:hypothetical protein